VGDAHGRVGRVDALPAGSARAEDVDADVLLVDLHGVGGVDDRGHVDHGERRLPPGLVVERRDADQPVHAVLAGERAVGVRHLGLEDDALHAGLLGLLPLVHVERVAVALGPAVVHPPQHQRPVLAVDAAGARE
jgi:hypothetical protein